MRATWLVCLGALLSSGCSGGGAASTGSGGGPPDAGPSDAGLSDAGDAGDAAAPPDCSAAGVWKQVAQSDVGRYAPGAAVLPSGEVLLAGGWDTAKKAQKTALLYDPATDALTPAGSLSRARNFPAVAPIPGGFLFAGGFNDYVGSENHADVYDVSKAQLAATGTMMEARELFSATPLPDGRVVVMGGLSAIGLAVRTTAELYDPVKGTFSAGGTLLHPRFGQATLYVPDVGRVLVVGGKTIGPSGDVFVPEAEWYDPATQTFSPAGALAHARDRATADFLPDGRVIVCGGSNGTDQTLASSELFDPQTSTFAAGPPLVTRRMAHTSTRLADGRIVLVGGWSDATMPSASSSTAEVLDPVAMAFTALPPLAEARHDHAAPRVTPCGVVVAGGIQVVQGGATKTPLGVERIELGGP